MSYRPLDTMAATASFLEAVGARTDDEVASAAFAIALLGEDEARTLVAELNLPEHLFPNSSTSPFLSDLNFARMLETHDPAKGVVGAAVLFSRHWVAANQGDATRIESLRKILEYLNRDNAPHPEQVRILAAEMSKVVVVAPPPPHGESYLLSISIDLVGSTDAKTRVMRVASGDQQRTNELNLDIYEQFCRIEKSFYLASVSRHAATPAIPLDRFFTVKGIGDELWVLCNVAPSEVFDVGHRLIDAAIRVAAQSVRFLALRRQEGPNFSREFDPGKIEAIASPVKIYVDLIKNASDLGARREDLLAREIPDLLRESNQRSPTRAEIMTITRRLGLAYSEPIGTATARALRTDYIGHEIDRFFRATKAALPGIVTVGETLLKEMRLALLPVRENIYAVQTNEAVPLRAGMPEDPLHCYISSSEIWKGIGYVYSTYGIFGPRTLKGLYVQMDADRGNGVAALPYDETASVISRAMLDELVHSIVAT